MDSGQEGAGGSAMRYYSSTSSIDIGSRASANSGKNEEVLGKFPREAAVMARLPGEEYS